MIVGLLLPYGPKHLQSHYEVIVAVHPTQDRFVTINPAKGWRIRSWADLDAEWRPAHRPTLVVLGVQLPTEPPLTSETSGGTMRLTTASNSASLTSPPARAATLRHTPRVW